MVFYMYDIIIILEYFKIAIKSISEGFCIVVFELLILTILIE